MREIGTGGERLVGGDDRPAVAAQRIDHVGDEQGGDVGFVQQ